MAIHIHIRSSFKLSTVSCKSLSCSAWRANQVDSEKLSMTGQSHVDIIHRIKKTSDQIMMAPRLTGPFCNSMKITMRNGRKVVSSNWIPKQPVSSIAKSQCHSLHTKLAPQGLERVPFDETNENAVSGIGEAGNNYIKPYKYTADDIFIDKLELPGNKNEDTINKVDVNHMNQIISNVMQEKYNLKEENKIKSPYGSNYMLDLIDMLGFQRDNLNALMSDLKQYSHLIEAENAKGLNNQSTTVNQDHQLKCHSTSTASSHVLLFASDPNASDEMSNKPKDKPNMDQLTQIQNIFTDLIPKVFVNQHDYRLYTKDVILENNYSSKPKRTDGLSAYCWQVAKLRLSAHLAFANVRMSVIGASSHEDEGCVRINWRMSGIPQTRALAFWKFMPWNYSKNFGAESDSSDGISTLFVNGDGLVYKHQVDKVIKDKQPETVKRKSLVEKMSLAPEPGLATSSNQT